MPAATLAPPALAPAAGGLLKAVTVGLPPAGVAVGGENARVAVAGGMVTGAEGAATNAVEVATEAVAAVGVGVAAGVTTDEIEVPPHPEARSSNVT